MVENGLIELWKKNETSQPAFICSKLTTETLEQGVEYVQSGQYRQWRRFGVSIVNFEYVSKLVLVILLLTLNM